MLIDAHCHINSLSGYQKKEVLERVRSNFIFIDISIDYESALASLQLSRSYDFIYTSLGFHPATNDTFSLETIGLYRKLLGGNEKIVAIGEVGLDYKSQLPLEVQTKILSEFIKLSKEFSLPVVIHNRWQDEAILDILGDEFDDFSKVIFHCFSQSKDFVAKIIEKKGLISFSLNILRGKNSIRESLQAVPLDSLLLETDSPYMKIDGALSSPLDIEKVYNFVANIRGISFSELSGIICSNTERALGIRI